MHEPRINHKPNLVARLKLMAFTDHGGDFFGTKLGDDLDFRAGRFYDLNYCIRATFGENEVFGSHAIDRRTSIAATWRCPRRRARTARPLKFELAVRAHNAFQEIHRGRSDKSSH